MKLKSILNKRISKIKDLTRTEFKEKLDPIVKDLEKSLQSFYSDESTANYDEFQIQTLLKIKCEETLTNFVENKLIEEYIIISDETNNPKVKEYGEERIIDIGVRTFSHGTYFNRITIFKTGDISKNQFQMG